MLDVAGKKITVMGLGRFGGGIGVTRWLVSQGADVLVTDLSPADELAESVAQIDDLVRAGAVSLRLGEHNVSDFTTCDAVVANPAVPKPWDNRFLRAAEAANIPITTEMSLLIDRLPSRARTIAITGSVGKSTTTAMIAHTLTTLTGNVALGGNIGGSLLTRLEGVDPIGGGTWIVLEVSSAMLYWLGRTNPTPNGWSPRVAVATNISANHIDWHGSFDHYRDCKQALLRHQQPGDTAILGRTLADWAPLTRGRAIVVDPASFIGQLKIPGSHNRENAAVARAACLAAVTGLQPGAVDAALADFPGLPHRLELVAERTPSAGARVRFYNDSKSTTPDATLRAVEAISQMPGMSPSRIHLIAGGYDKKIDLSPIAALGPTLAGMYTVGATGASLASQAGPNARFVETVEHAVQAALASMKPGDALLLSPGCASWDQFTNYEERGRVFADACRAAAETRTKA